MEKQAAAQKCFYPTHTHLGPVPQKTQSARHANVAAATQQAKAVLLKTKNWPATKDHVFYWIKSRYGVSRTTAADYLVDVRLRLLTDKEVKEYLG